MRYDLAAMASRQGLKRRETAFAPILTTSAQANDLAAISRRIIAPWLDAKTAITEIYARELARRLQQDAIDELTSLLAALGAEVERLILDLTPSLKTWAFRVEGWHRGKWSRSVLAGTDVDISTLIGPADALEAIETFMARQTALIRNVSDEARSKIADIVYRGLQQRLPSRQVGKAITEALGLSRRRANRIAADQSTKLAAALDAQRQREAGLSEYRYRHSGKLHFRPQHKARDSRIFELNTNREVEFKNGKKTYTGHVIEDGDAPGEPPFCGCVREGLLVIDGEVL